MKFSTKFHRDFNVIENINFNEISTEFQSRDFTEISV